MEVVTMTPAYAADVVTWRYPAPYDTNDMTGADPGFLADPASGYYALTDETGLIGFRSFGADGQVPGWAYDDRALDTGGGLWPELQAGRDGLTAQPAPGELGPQAAAGVERGVVVRPAGHPAVGPERPEADQPGLVGEREEPVGGVGEEGRVGVGHVVAVVGAG